MKLVVVNDDAADVASREHVVVALVDVRELVFGSDGFVEQQLALAVQAEQARNVGARVRLAVETARSRFWNSVNIIIDKVGACR